MKQATLFDQKHKVCVNITEYAKMTLTARANSMGLKLSAYLEFLARQPAKNPKGGDIL